uniref:Uncharacterized protein n=1 Tax=Clastoptera arizonana TaxID=38151 RepID=A0A1B6BZL0_9HEMI
MKRHSSNITVIPTTTRENSGYIITSESHTTAGPGGCVLVKTKQELRLLIIKETADCICTDLPTVPRCPPANLAFPLPIIPIDITQISTNTKTQTRQKNRPVCKQVCTQTVSYIKSNKTTKTQDQSKRAHHSNSSPNIKKGQLPTSNLGFLMQ